MPKHAKCGKASIKVPFQKDVFLKSLFHDLAPWCDVRPLIQSWMEDPASLLGVSEELSLLAESRLSEGQSYACYRQVSSLLKKNTDWYGKDQGQRRLAAYDKFASSEVSCRRANKRLDFYRRHWNRAGFADQVINDAALMCQGILGTVSDDVIEEIFDDCKHGSGLTFDATEPEHRNLYFKLQREGSVTPKALPYLLRYAKTSSNYGRDLFAPKVVRGNRVTSVPKTAQIDRTIAIEPSYNVFLQKGVDAAMRRRLSRVGLRLSDQTHNHGQAREGSISGELATMDLSSASDTVSIELVRRLLPSDWFALLDDLRSHEYCDSSGEWRRYAKFSSMGNAFTFPLESLVFYTLAKACMSYTDSDFSQLRVYGDDIIVPQEAYALLSEVLTYAGFKVNPDKSYPFGWFRETCGCDYINGVDVRPVYLTRWPRTVTEVYSLHNRLLTLSRVPLPTVLSYLASIVHRPHKGPMYLLRGDKPWRASENVRHDSYLITDPPERHSFYDEDTQSLVYRERCVAPVPKRLIVKSERAAYLAFLLGVPKGEIKSAINIPLRERTCDYRHWPTIHAGLRLLGG